MAWATVGMGGHYQGQSSWSAAISVLRNREEDGSNTSSIGSCDVRPTHQVLGLPVEVAGPCTKHDPRVSATTRSIRGRAGSRRARSDEAYLGSIESPPARAYAWRALRSFYAFVAEEQEAPSIMVRVKSPNVPLTEVTTATEDDYDKLIKACSPFRTATQARDAAIIATFWATGLRRSELAALKVSDMTSTHAPSSYSARRPAAAGGCRSTRRPPKSS
jgi:hypothetical protein